LSIVVDRGVIVRIRFQFDRQKAIQALVYLLRGLGGSADKAKLMKLLYIADRDSFLQHGCPITGDDQYAMPYGPVPSAALDLLYGEYEDSDQMYRYLGVVNSRVAIGADPGDDRLSPEDKQVLDRVLDQYGGMRTWDLVRRTHEFPEYKECYSEGSSRRIPYETMLRVYETGDGSRFRLGRPVVPEATMRRMECPFPPWTE
jgi:uncharacterized phage-associated protein